MRKPVLAAIACLPILALGACGAPPEAGEADVAGYVYSTSLTLGADGAIREETVRMTVAQMQAEIASRRQAEAGAVQDVSGTGVLRQGLTVDRTCSASSLWLYDQPFQNHTNSGNRLCISGPREGGDREAAFGYVCRRWFVLGGTKYCATYWDAAVRGYWPGADGGHFVPLSDSAPCPSVPNGWDGWSAWGPQTNPGLVGQCAYDLLFDP